jgi:ribonucleotide reductase alpha subunit
MGDSLVHTVPVASNEKEMGKKEERKLKKEEAVMEKKSRPAGEGTKKTYTYDEAIKATRDYFGGDDLAAKVWASKYALKDSFGNLYEKTPDDMHRRLASEIYRIEQKYPNPLSLEAIYEAFRDFKYIIPQGGPMTGIGNDYQIASLSNCFELFALIGQPF